MAEPAHSDEPLLKTPLHAEHVALGARMVPFAGYDMPVQYPAGILTEHNWTREHAGLFDVSHMGQAFLVAEDKSHETVAKALEALIPADVLNLKPNQQRYSQLLSRGWRHPRRSHGHPRRRSRPRGLALPRGERLHEGRRLRPYPGATAEGRFPESARTDWR